MSEFERSVPNSTPRSPIRQGSVPNSTGIGPQFDSSVPNSTGIGPQFDRDRSPIRLLGPQFDRDRSPIRQLRFPIRQLSVLIREIGTYSVGPQFVSSGTYSGLRSLAYAVICKFIMMFSLAADKFIDIMLLSLVGW